MPEPAGAVIVTVLPADTVEGWVLPPTDEAGTNLGCNPGTTSTDVIEMAIRSPAIAKTARAGLFDVISSCSLKPYLH
jgi:hypothetical protein